MSKSSWGGENSPSPVVRNNFTGLVLPLFIAAGGLLLGATPGQTQRVFRPHFPQAHPRPPRQNNPRPRIDPAIAPLLQKMLRPTANYSGEQMTEAGGTVSRQRISGDTSGRVRLDYDAPTNMAGDVMVRGPGHYRYLHSRSNTLDVALWPTQFNENDRKALEAIRAGQVQAAIVGQETVAGRNTAIVALTAAGHVRKLWIDTETGIQVKIEHSGPNGLISRSYLTSVQIGAAAGITGQTFNIPNQSRMRINTLFPDGTRFDSLEAARPQLPFTPLVPSADPSGFRLSGVWVFNVNPKKPGSGSVLLRYNDGMSNFSLFERINGRARAAAARPGKYRGSMQNWRLALPDGSAMEVTYIGHLTPEQVAALHDSLR